MMTRSCAKCWTHSCPLSNGVPVILPAAVPLTAMAELETEDSIADLQSLASEVYHRAQFLNPLNPEYAVRLGMLAMSTSNPLHPYLPSLLLCLPSPLPCTDDTEPSEKFSTDRMEEARSFFERALRLCPGDTSAALERRDRA